MPHPHPYQFNYTFAHPIVIFISFCLYISKNDIKYIYKYYKDYITFVCKKTLKCHFTHSIEITIKTLLEVKCKYDLSRVSPVIDFTFVFSGETTVHYICIPVMGKK